MKHGQGKYKSHDDSFWEGEWIYGKREGLGSLTVGQKRYAAQWLNGVPASFNHKGGQMSRKMSRLSV